VKQLKPSAIADSFSLCLFTSFVEAKRLPATAQKAFRQLHIEEESG
jgi:hypothetical protein